HVETLKVLAIVVGNRRQPALAQFRFDVLRVPWVDAPAETVEDGEPRGARRAAGAATASRLRSGVSGSAGRRGRGAARTPAPRPPLRLYSRYPRARVEPRRAPARPAGSRRPRALARWGGAALGPRGGGAPGDPGGAGGAGGAGRAAGRASH